MADPQLTLAWWDKNRPKTLPSTGFGDALKKYEAALKAFDAGVKQGGNVKDLHDKLGKALDAVKAGAADATKKCNKTLHKDAIKVLGTVTSTTIPNEKKRIDAAFAHYRMVQQTHAEDVRKMYDAREKVVQNLLKNEAAAKKGFEAIFGAVLDLQQERQKLVAGAKKGNKPAKADIDKFTKSATSIRQDAESWFKQFGPIVRAQFPQIDMKKLSDGERKQFNAQVDKRDNCLVRLDHADGRVESLIKDGIPKMIKEVAAAG